MAGSKIIPHLVIVESLDQTEENALAVTLNGQPANARIIFNSALGKTRVWNGTAFASANSLNSDGSTNYATAFPTVEGPTGKYLRDDLTWQPMAGSGGLSTVILSADRTNNNAVANTIQDITGLSFDVIAGKMYYFKFVIYYTSAATTTGSRWAVNCSAGNANNLSMTSEYSLTATTTTRNANVQAFNSPSACNATSAAIGNNMAVMEGYFIPSANGTFTARFASEVSNSAIVAKAGSVCYYQQLN